MKMTYRLRSQQAGPIWGVIFGLFLTGIGIGLWCYTKFLRGAGPLDELLAVGAFLVGVLSAVYAVRELFHQHR